jgi:hypothetical protein
MFLMHGPEEKHKSFFVMKTNQMHCLALIYFVSRPQHVSDMFLMHRPSSKHKLILWNENQPDALFSVNLFCQLISTCFRHVPDASTFVKTQIILRNENQPDALFSLRAGLDGCGKSRPHQDSIPGPSSL